MPVSEKKKASNDKWNKANMKYTSVGMRIEEYEKVKAYCEESGETINGFLRRAALDAIGRDAGQQG